MRSVNKVILMGNVGSDPEIRETKAGQKVAVLSVATSPPWNDQETNWHKVVGWDKVADLIEQYVNKGDGIHIIGRLRYSQWQDKEGNNRKTAEVVIEELNFLGKRSAPTTPATPQAPAATESASTGDNDPDLPF